MSEYRNIVIAQGETWEMTLWATDQYGQPLDLTDYNVVMRMKKSFHAKAYIEFHTEIVDPIKGEIRVWLDETETRQIKPLRYVYDCILNGALSTTNPLTLRFMDGIVSVMPSVSI